MGGVRRGFTVWQLAVVVFGLATIWLAVQLQMTGKVAPELKNPWSSANRGADAKDKITLVMVTYFDDIPRSLAGIASLRRNMPDWAVHELLFVVPYAESLILPSLLSQQNDFSNTWPIRVVAEHEVLGVSFAELTRTPDFPTFYFKYKLQMLLKLFVARLIVTDFYLVLDSDVVMVQPLQSMRWLFPEKGRAIYNPEPRKIHTDWWDDTETFLELRGCLSRHPMTPAFGVTPAILSKAIADKTVANMMRVFGTKNPQDWLEPLLANDLKYKLWTEYTAYRLTACKFKMFEKHHMVQVPGAPQLYGGCWTPESALNVTIKAPDNIIFLVVQSNTKVPVKKIVTDLVHVFSDFPVPSM